MQAMKCELCGSSDIVKKDGLFVCQHCGTKYSVEEAKKLIGVVTIDKTKDIENWKVLAKRSRFEGNAVNAAKYYGMIVEQEPENWEASFFHVYYQTVGCDIKDSPNGSNAVCKAFTTALSLMKNELNNSSINRKEYLVDAYKQLFAALASFSDVIISNIAKWRAENAGKHKNTIETKQNLNDIKQWYCAAIRLVDIIAVAASKCAEVRTDPLYLVILDKDIKTTFPNAWVLSDSERQEITTRLEKEVKYVDPDYNVPNVKKTGCYIATCVYGSYDCPEVWTLRRYRDTSLSMSWYGRLFIRCYYAVSPLIVKRFGHIGFIRRLWKEWLDNLIVHLQSKGFSSDYYQD